MFGSTHRQLLVIRLLEKRGHRVIVFGNGREASAEGNIDFWPFSRRVSLRTLDAITGAVLLAIGVRLALKRA
jgi:hypothetical protein